MRRVLVLAAVGALAVCGTASAYLSKLDARAAAASTAYELGATKPWIATSRVGACRRLSPHRVNCAAKVTGSEMKECEDEPPYDCLYAYHSCHFLVRVHEAGYEAIGRPRRVRCRERFYYG